LDQASFFPIYPKLKN